MANSALKLAEAIEDLGNSVEDAALDEAKDGLDEVQADARSNVAHNDSAVTGDLMRDITVRRTPRGWSIVVDDDTPKPTVLEFGSGPLFGTTGLPSDIPNPPDAPSFGHSGRHSELLESLQEWIEMKPVVGREYSDRRKSDGTPSELSFAIAESISTVGTKPHPYLRPAWYTHQHRIKRGVRKAVARQAKRSFKTV